MQRRSFIAAVIAALVPWRRKLTPVYRVVNINGRWIKTEIIRWVSVGTASAEPSGDPITFDSVETMQRFCPLFGPNIEWHEDAQ